MATVNTTATLLLTNAFQTVYSGILDLTVSVIRITNVTGGAVTVRLCQVPPGSSPSISNATLWDFSMPANDFLEFGQGDLILADTSLQAMAGSNNAIVIKLSGLGS